MKKHPISPFLSIYKLQRGSFFSIFSRVSGLLLFFIFLLALFYFFTFPLFLSWWTFYSFLYFLSFNGYSYSFCVFLLLFFYGFYYHLLVGARYFFMSFTLLTTRDPNGVDPFVSLGRKGVTLIAFLTFFLTVFTFLLV